MGGREEVEGRASKGGRHAWLPACISFESTFWTYPLQAWNLSMSPFASNSTTSKDEKRLP